MNHRQRTYEPRIWFFVAVIGYSLIARLLPYSSDDPTQNLWIWNFSPLYGICLFGAAYYRQTRWAFAVPLATYLVGDFGIWAVTGRPDWAIYPGQPYVYASVALFVVAGLLLRTRRSWLAVGGAGLTGAIMFYVVSNFGVWAGGGLYPHTLDGLVTCYVAALPSLGKCLLSTFLFSAVLFSPIGVRALEASEQDLSPDLKPARERVTVQS